jgi:hypothetical protein
LCNCWQFSDHAQKSLRPLLWDFCPPKPIGPPAPAVRQGPFFFAATVGAIILVGQNLRMKISFNAQAQPNRCKLNEGEIVYRQRVTASSDQARRERPFGRRAVWPLDNLSINSLGEYRCLRCAECRLVGYLKQREQYLHSFLCPDPAVYVLVGHDEPLRVGQADRDHHPSASLELID